MSISREEAEKVVAGLSMAQRAAVLSEHRRNPRAGDLFPGQGNIMGNTWLRSTPLFARYMHGGYFAYRLTPLGLACRNLLSERDQ